jgi:hypothetical protein
VTVTATVDVAEDETPDDGIRAGGTFLEPLVVRLHAEFGVEPHAIRSLATEVLASFAGARVRAFVPILVEKRLRGHLRSRGADAILHSMPVGESHAVSG